MNLLETKIISCPYCGELIELVIDKSIPQQTYIEDCEVCCRPIQLNILVEDDEAMIYPSHEND